MKCFAVSRIRSDVVLTLAAVTMVAVVFLLRDIFKRKAYDPAWKFCAVRREHALGVIYLTAGIPEKLDRSISIDPLMACPITGKPYLYFRVISPLDRQPVAILVDSRPHNGGYGATYGSQMLLVPAGEYEGFVSLLSNGVWCDLRSAPYSKWRRR